MNRGDTREPEGAQTTRSSSAAARRRLAIGLAYLAGATLFALFTFSVYTTTALADREYINYRRTILFELTGGYSIMLLIPLVLRFMKRYPIGVRNWTRRVPLHLAVSVAFGASLTLMMWGSRTVMFRVLGWGPFNYGHLGYRFIMEYEKQFAIYWSIYGIASLFAYARESRERELQASRLEKQLTEARLNALKMQLNPHFLFNTLNMISSYVYEDARTAEKMITKLSDLLRLTLNDADQQEVPMQKEIEFLDAYLAIMKARFQERLSVALSIDPAARKLLIPHLILQPLVENSIRHCTSDFARPGEVRLAASPREGFLRVVLEDNGPGIPGQGTDPARNGIGLSNTRMRLQQLYGGNHRFELVNRDEGGLRITLEVPIREAAAEAVRPS